MFTELRIVFNPGLNNLKLELTDLASSLALSSLNPWVAKILWPADSTCAQIPRSKWLVVISPSSPAFYTIHEVRNLQPNYRYYLNLVSVEAQSIEQKQQQRQTQYLLTASITTIKSYLWIQKSVIMCRVSNKTLASLDGTWKMEKYR